MVLLSEQRPAIATVSRSLEPGPTAGTRSVWEKRAQRERASVSPLCTWRDGFPLPAQISASLFLGFNKAETLEDVWVILAL